MTAPKTEAEAIANAKRAVDKMPGIKGSQLRQCIRGHGLAKNGNPMFFRVTVERCILDPGAITKRAGMEAMFGGGKAGAVLAGVMGPDEDLAKVIDGPTTLFICGHCGMGIERGSISAMEILMPDTKEATDGES